MYQMVCELCGGVCKHSRLSHEHFFKFEGLTFKYQMFVSGETGLPHICEECLERMDKAFEDAITAPMRQAMAKVT